MPTVLASAAPDAPHVKGPIAPIVLTRIAHRRRPVVELHFRVRELAASTAQLDGQNPPAATLDAIVAAAK